MQTSQSEGRAPIGDAHLAGLTRCGFASEESGGSMGSLDLDGAPSPEEPEVVPPAAPSPDAASLALQMRRHSALWPFQSAW